MTIPSDIAGLSERLEWLSSPLAEGMSEYQRVNAFVQISGEVKTALDALTTRVKEADEACQRLCGAHGFATGHGDSVADMIDEISAQIGERLNEVRRLASGPEGGSPLTAASDGEVG